MHTICQTCENHEHLAHRGMVTQVVHTYKKFNVICYYSKMRGLNCSPGYVQGWAVCLPKIVPIFLMESDEMLCSICSIPRNNLFTTIDGIVVLYLEL